MGTAGKEILTVKDSKFGKGTFATQNISQGSAILKIKGKKLTFSDSVEMGDRESYCLQIGIDKYIIPDEPFRYSNHSCDPNAGINSKLELVAIRPIALGDEVLWDYSSSMLERHWTMHCDCESIFCRQIITDFDLLPGHIQEFYLHRGMVMPFIKLYLKQQSSIQMRINVNNPLFNL